MKIFPLLSAHPVEYVSQNSIEMEPVKPRSQLKFIRRTTTESPENFVEFVTSYELENFDDSDDISRSAILTLVG
jgi:hypothetical protein